MRAGRIARRFRIEPARGTIVAASLRDITERKRADDALCSANEELARAREAADASTAATAAAVWGSSSRGGWWT